MAIEFVLPEFLQSGTDVETIHKRMLAELPGDIDATEGGFVWDFTRPAAVLASELLEFWIPETLKLLFANTSSGKYLDYLAEQAKTSRKGATRAMVQLAFTGEPSATIPAGTRVSTAALAGEAGVEFQTIESCTLDVSGTGTAWAIAMETGPRGNVDADTLVMFVIPISRVTSVTNPEAATGGTAEESDDDLRARIESINQAGDSSLVGNVADYKRWAEEVDGVGTATVIPEWDGPQTVKIVITDANGDAPNQAIQAAVYNHLMRPDDPLQRLTPPDMTLTIAVPELIDIEIEATVEAKDGYTLGDICEACMHALRAYSRQASAEGEVKYTVCGAILSGLDGVNDYCDLTINGDVKNIPISLGQFPYIQRVEFTPGEVE